MSKTLNFAALDKEFTELDKKRRFHQQKADKAFDRMWEIWGIVAKHQKEFYEWKREG